MSRRGRGAALRDRRSKDVNEDNGLQTLIDLQQIDSRIALLRDQIAAVPERLEKLEARRLENAARLERAQQSLEEHRKLRRQLENQVASLNEKLSHFKSQQTQVKTNREYQALLHEISATEEEIQRDEDQILESMLATDELAAEVSSTEAQVREADRELAEQRQELELFSSGADDEMTRLEARRDGLQKKIPEELRALYERIVSARGVALAEARDQSCQVCHVRLRPQLYNEVKSGQYIHTCENCNRILYFAGTS